MNNYFIACKSGDFSLLYKAISVNQVNYILFRGVNFSVDLKYAEMSSVSCKFFLTYYYNSILRLSVIGASNAKGKKKRSFVGNLPGVKGFKMLVCGRFSRKQRASRVCLVKGSVPLGTKMAIIDYGFSTVVLRNSIVSIKI